MRNKKEKKNPYKIDTHTHDHNHKSRMNYILHLINRDKFLYFRTRVFRFLFFLSLAFVAIDFVETILPSSFSFSFSFTQWIYVGCVCFTESFAKCNSVDAAWLGMLQFLSSWLIYIQNEWSFAKQILITPIRVRSD